ncbi:hypothetical protein PBY51_004668 [Eleginops maclovinus]|uniref:Uncharacterized protein n=1 Tax=Eleginops maclovinus TaxID=56733 RepID=A0AAN7X3Y4_ELEMC|nr:hypothetical protein PBY51_004668 [Eleginops maclovinus]
MDDDIRQVGGFHSHAVNLPALENIILHFLLRSQHPPTAAHRVLCIKVNTHNGQAAAGWWAALLVPRSET